MSDGWKIAVTAYVCIALMFAIWVDAMDGHYLADGYHRTFLVALMEGASWPIAMPLALTVIASGDCDIRWKLRGCP